MRYAETRHYPWGDEVSGEVKDRYYASSHKIHMAMFSLPPGGLWRHSDRHKSYYGADECYYLLAGELTIHNPETGEVKVHHQGEALHFRERTWHYGYNFAQVKTVIICTSHRFRPTSPRLRCWRLPCRRSTRSGWAAGN